jgi:peptide/nickel transport system permease protein
MPDKKPSKSLKTKLQEWKTAREPGIKELRFMLNRIRKSPLSLIGSFIILLYVVMAVSAPYIAPPNPRWDLFKVPDPFIIPDATNTVEPAPPSTDHPLGLTVDGYDIYYGCIWGAITAFRVGVYVVALALAIGLSVGLIAGYYGGLIDEVLMRFTDIIIAFPGLILSMALAIALPSQLNLSLVIFLPIIGAVFLILAIMDLLKPDRTILFKRRTFIFVAIASALLAEMSLILFGTVQGVTVFSLQLTKLDKVLIALILVGWPGYTRVIRGEVLRARNEDYVEAARAVGCSDFRIIFRHIVPNTIYPILILASLDVGSIVLTAAALSFLGIGADPNYADWGQLVQKSQTYMGTGPQLMTFWYIWVIPGVFIFTFGLGWNLLGDAIRDILDPTLRRR